MCTIPPLLSSRPPLIRTSGSTSHLQMLLHAHQHAFTPFPHQTCVSGIPAAPVGTQDRNVHTHPHRGSTRPSFASATAFHRVTKKSFESTKRGSWGALHVCIAWKIYYNEKLKKKQPTLEYPASIPPDQSDLSFNPSNHGPLRGHLKSHPFDPSPWCHSDMSKKVELDQLQHPLWKEKLDEEKHRSQQINKTKDLPLKDKSLDQTVTAGHDGRLANSTVRKRQLDCDSFLDGKRAKKERMEDHFDSSNRKPNRHISDLHPSSNRCKVPTASSGFISYPGAELHPYRTMWDLNKGMALYCSQNIPKDHTFKTCKVIRIPPVAQRPKDAFYACSSTPLYFPQQETLYHREREFLHSQQQLCHFQRSRYQLAYPGFLQTPHLGH